MGWYCTKRIRVVLVQDGLRIRVTGVVNVVQGQRMHQAKQNVLHVRTVIGIMEHVVFARLDIFVLAGIEESVLPVHIKHHKVEVDVKHVPKVTIARKEQQLKRFVRLVRIVRKVQAVQHFVRQAVISHQPERANVFHVQQDIIVRKEQQKRLFVLRDLIVRQIQAVQRFVRQVVISHQLDRLIACLVQPVITVQRVPKHKSFALQALIVQMVQVQQLFVRQGPIVQFNPVLKRHVKQGIFV